VDQVKLAIPQELERGRVRSGPYATPPGLREGFFFAVCPLTKTELRIMVSDGRNWHEQGLQGHPWEHVSVSTEKRCPSWKEMCWVKDLFFDEQECVVQFHPPKSEYVNYHPNVLHLWRLSGMAFPMPPSICVGPKEQPCPVPTTA
jgi:hypothetical protein